MDLNQEQIHWINQKMAALGVAPDDRGRFSLRPERLFFDDNLWNRLTDGPEIPFLALDALYEDLKAHCLRGHLDRYADLLGEAPSLRQQRQELRQYLSDRLELILPREAVADTPVWLILGLNVDSFSDYTINVTYPAYGWQDYETEYQGCFHQSSLMWLTRRQGYSQRELREAQHRIKKASASPHPEKVIPSPYLYSVAHEIWGQLTIYNQLGFFLQVPLREALLLRTMQRWGSRHGKWPGFVLLDRHTVCGLFSTYVGSCSFLGIQMERDVKVPLCDVNVFPDGVNGYSIYEVCGNSKLWGLDRILHWGLPRQLRRDAAALGLPDLPPAGPRAPAQETP